MTVLDQAKRTKLAAAFQYLGFARANEANRENYSKLVESSQIGPLYFDQADEFASWFDDEPEMIDLLIERAERAKRRDHI
jgi:hypothetical protein